MNQELACIAPPETILGTPSTSKETNSNMATSGNVSATFSEELQNGADFYAPEKDYLYSMGDIVEITGLSEGKIRSYIRLGLIDPPHALGSGIRRFTQEDVDLLVKATELVKLGKRPHQAVTTLKGGYSIRSSELIDAVTSIDPQNQYSWWRFVEVLQTIDGLTEEEKHLFRFIATPNTDEGNDVGPDLIQIYASRNSLDTNEVRKMVNQIYMKLGYAIVSLVRLKHDVDQKNPRGFEASITFSET